jgi:hypothetical protein
VKLKNLYRTGLKDEYVKGATLSPNLAVFRCVTQSDLEAKTNAIILTGGQAEATMGVVLYELLSCGAVFQERWDCAPGDHFLLSHLAGDKLGVYVFAQADDIVLRWGKEIYE